MAAGAVRATAGLSWEETKPDQGTGGIRLGNPGLPELSPAIHSNHQHPPPLRHHSELARVRATRVPRPLLVLLGFLQCLAQPLASSLWKQCPPLAPRSCPLASFLSPWLCASEPCCGFSSDS